MDLGGSGIVTLDIVHNKIITVHYSNTNAENILPGTKSPLVTTVVIRADQMNRLLDRTK